MQRCLTSFQLTHYLLAQQIDIGHLLSQEVILCIGRLPQQASQTVRPCNEGHCRILAVAVVDGKPERQRSGLREWPEASVLMPWLLRRVPWQLAKEMGTPTYEVGSQDRLHGTHAPRVRHQLLHQWLMQRP